MYEDGLNSLIPATVVVGRIGSQNKPCATTVSITMASVTTTPPAATLTWLAELDDVGAVVLPAVTLGLEILLGTSSGEPGT